MTTDAVLPLVSIILVNYNGGEVIERCLAALVTEAAPSTPTKEIIVVDNESEDGSADRIAARFPMVRLLRAGENLGFSRGCNLGASVAAGSYLLFLNADTHPNRAFLGSLVNCLERRPDAAAAGPALLYPNGALQLSCGALPSVGREAIDRVRYARAARRAASHRGGGAIDPPAEARAAERAVGWLTGACLLVRTEAFRDIGGFDPAIFMYFEDKDLCRRLADRGWTLLFCPRAALVHELGGSSSRRDDSRLRRIYLESQSYYYRKHHGPIQNALLRLYRSVAR